MWIPRRAGEISVAVSYDCVAEYEPARTMEGPSAARAAVKSWPRPRSTKRQPVAARGVVRTLQMMRSIWEGKEGL